MLRNCIIFYSSLLLGHGVLAGASPSCHVWGIRAQVSEITYLNTLHQHLQHDYRRKSLAWNVGSAAGTTRYRHSRHYSARWHLYPGQSRLWAWQKWLSHSPWLCTPLERHWCPTHHRTRFPTGHCVGSRPCQSTGPCHWQASVTSLLKVGYSGWCEQFTYASNSCAHNHLPNRYILTFILLRT